jgi:two-component system OmpR family response regulator
MSTDQDADSNCRILIVEDDTDSARFFSQILLRFAYDVQTARNGTEALVVATGFRPHVVFVDIGLPGLDGLYVAKELRKTDPEILLVATTGRSSPEDISRSIAAGFDHHFTKPLDVSAIISLLAEWRAVDGCQA